ncbi:methylmalonyl Co-A mutase-associated GTPase MeaB [bacterium]|nr:methylmalonyl Co-A mutase-associated GTPase MeaB [bacterium]
MISVEDRARNFAERILQGQVGAAARAMTWVENMSPEAEPLLTALAPHQGKAQRVGVTGPPGAGKSTLVDSLVRVARGQNHKVGVVAVDPSSPFSGGALLGDRVRMSRSLEDPDVFVRSMAARGCLGGLARTAQEAADILEALGKDFLCLETVGVGQSELAIAQSCDTCTVVLVPEAGGVIQAMKAGLMEIADIFVVNKADRPNVDEMQRQLMEAASFAERDQWRPPVLKVTAIEGQGIGELYAELRRHWDWLQDAGRLDKKRQVQHQARIRELVRAALEERLWSEPAVLVSLAQAADQLRMGQIGLHQAAQKVWAGVRERLAHTSLE